MTNNVGLAYNDGDTIPPFSIGDSRYIIFSVVGACDGCLTPSIEGVSTMNVPCARTNLTLKMISKTQH
jgi:hypothetical protein